MRKSKITQNKTFPLMRSHGSLPTWVNKTNPPVNFLECFTLKHECFIVYSFCRKSYEVRKRSCYCAVDLYGLT